MPEPSNPFPLIYLLLGFACTVAGVAWIYRPAGLIVAGGFLLLAAFLGRKRKTT
jgi:hypothetical protein